jgi:hypothetical protein
MQPEIGIVTKKQVNVAKWIGPKSKTNWIQQQSIKGHMSKWESIYQCCLVALKPLVLLLHSNSTFGSIIVHSVFSTIFHPLDDPYAKSYYLYLPLYLHNTLLQPIINICTPVLFSYMWTSINIIGFYNISYLSVSVFFKKHKTRQNNKLRMTQIKTRKQTPKQLQPLNNRRDKCTTD